MPRPLRGRRRGKEGEGGDLTAHFGGDILRVDGLARAVGVVEKTADHVVLDVVVNVPAQAHARVDTAIHHAKRQGRANYQFYTSALSSDVQRRMEVEAGLRHALENSEFELYYQAKVDLAAHMVTGAEALLRWDSPALGFVSPAEFIPIAEQAGLIVAIGNWVLRNACFEAAG